MKVDGKGKVILKSPKGIIEINSGETLGINEINSNYTPIIENEKSSNKPNEIENKEINIDIDILVDIRDKARSKKLWDISDQVRDILLSNNIELEDNPDGSKWKKN